MPVIPPLLSRLSCARSRGQRGALMVSDRLDDEGGAPPTAVQQYPYDLLLHTYLLVFFDIVRLEFEAGGWSSEGHRRVFLSTKGFCTAQTMS